MFLIFKDRILMTLNVHTFVSILVIKYLIYLNTIVLDFIEYIISLFLMNIYFSILHLNCIDWSRYRKRDQYVLPVHKYV